MNTKTTALNFAGEFWINHNDEVFVDARRVRLLEEIAAGHSMAESARRLGMGYKTAWDLLYSMNELAAEPIAISTRGGSQGGGTVITEYGQRLIHNFRLLESEYKALLLALEQRYPELNEAQNLSQRLQLQSSARNQLMCSIQSLEKKGHRIMATLHLGQQQYIRAMITQASIDAMGLSVGRQVISLLKAPNITLSQTPQSSMDNLEGQIESIDPDDMGGAEVYIRLLSGQLLVAVTEDAAQLPPITSSIHAMIDPKQVILATF